MAILCHRQFNVEIRVFLFLSVLKNPPRMSSRKNIAEFLGKSGIHCRICVLLAIAPFSVFGCRRISTRLFIFSAASHYVEWPHEAIVCGMKPSRRVINLFLFFLLFFAGQKTKLSVGKAFKFREVKPVVHTKMKPFLHKDKVSNRLAYIAAASR